MGQWTGLDWTLLADRVTGAGNRTMDILWTLDTGFWTLVRRSSEPLDACSDGRMFISLCIKMDITHEGFKRLYF